MSANVETQCQVLIRPYLPKEDEAFVYSTWRDALWFGENPHSELNFAKRVKTDASKKFYSESTKRIRNLIETPGVFLRVACWTEHPDLIIGYSAMHLSHLYWVFVKIEYRNEGVGSLLTSGFKTVSEPQTRIGKALVTEKKIEVL